MQNDDEDDVWDDASNTEDLNNEQYLDSGEPLYTD
jgi:hypothetical protein